MSARGSVAGLLAALLAGRAIPATADVVEATATLLVTGRQEPRDGQVHTVVPAYGLVWLRADRITNPLLDDLRIVVTGWGAVQPGEPRHGRLEDFDLNLAFVEGGLWNRRIRVRVGRQLRIGGSARNFLFDGGWVEIRALGPVGLSLYGGAPVTPRFATAIGDALAGARLFYRPSFDTEVGVSFLHLLDRGYVARQEAALDARWVPLRVLTLSAFASVSTAEMRLAEAEASVRWEVTEPVEVSLEARRTAPDLFLPRTSIFSVFSEEERDEWGGSLYVRLGARTRLHADYHVLRVAADSGLGHDGGARVRHTLGRRSRSSLGAEARFLQIQSNGYAHGRLFARHRLSEILSVTLDVAGYWFLRPVNGQDLSATTTATVVWEFLPRWRVALVGLAGVTPYLEQRFEAMARLSYALALGTGQAR